MSQSHKIDLVLDESFDDARQRCLDAVKSLGWKLRKDLTSSDRITCYVPIPALLPRAPIYFIALYPLDEHSTHLILMASDDELSDSHAPQDLPLLEQAITVGVSPAEESAPTDLRAADAAGEEPANLIFISYRRYDSADAAGRIFDRLAAQFGDQHVFKDVDDIPLGKDFRRVIGDAVGQCQILLAVIGRDWLTVTNEHGQRRIDDPADFVRIEIESALQRGIPVIPLLVRGVSIPREEDLPDSLKELVYRSGIEIRPDPDFHRDMDRLIRALERLLAG